MKIHVIGSEDTIIGFGLIGISGTVVTKPEDAKELLLKLTNPKQYDLLIINSRLLEGLEEFTDEYRLNAENPILFDIPDERVIPTDHSLKQFVKKAFSV